MSKDNTYNKDESHSRDERIIESAQHTAYEEGYHSRDEKVEALEARKLQLHSVCKDLRASLVKQDALVNELVEACEEALRASREDGPLTWDTEQQIFRAIAKASR